MKCKGTPICKNEEETNCRCHAQRNLAIYKALTHAKYCKYKTEDMLSINLTTRCLVATATPNHLSPCETLVFEDIANPNTRHHLVQGFG
jgi:hypothetical protein